MFYANADDIVFNTTGDMLIRSGYGSLWVAAILGNDTPLRFGSQTHEVTAEQSSQLEHCELLHNVNPLTGRFNRTRVKRSLREGCVTLTVSAVADRRPSTT